MSTVPVSPGPGSAASDPARSARIRRLMQRAETYRGAGQAADAVASYQACLELDADHVAALLGLADLHFASGAYNDARRALLRAVSGHMESPRLVLQLMGGLSELSESGMMVEIARQLPPPMWDSAKSLAEVARLLSLIGAHELARDFARAGVARDPHHPPSLHILATLDVFFGDIESAAEHVERCLAILPGDPGSHWLLSRLRRPDAGPRIDRLQRELERALPGEAEAFLAYALHNELHDQRDYGPAWLALERACRAKRSTLDYSVASAERLFDALRTWSARDLQPRDGCESGPFDPVFVVGLHRSGTTLAERILGGHSQIKAGGETYDLSAQLRRASGRHFTGELDLVVVEGRERWDYRAIGEGYLSGMRWRSGGLPLVTDKLPSNYYNLGFIARALPRARFIHLRRDPVDVGLSSLRTLFSHACAYSYDQTEYVAHYRQYQRLMQHWRELFGDRILDVDYESLVQQPEATAATMARFCGVDYEPAMASIESRKDAVSTASSVMMRDGIRRDRGRVWKAYEQQLAPMITALAD